ncbi:MAG: glycosyltransferase family 2 protein [Cyclobacteriaceae bacterium]|nr:glycosyltransferase family 2 protein [Cyclobacteriaceae bacterium]
MTSTAVVILNYNGSELLRKFLPSVIEHSVGARIVVADNGSTDASIEVLKKEFPMVDLISIGSNLGYCGGYNFALKNIKEEYSVLLNSDVAVTSGWLTPLVKQLDEHPQSAAVQPKILSYQEQKSFEYAGAGGGYIDSFGYPFCRGRLFYAIEEDKGQYNNPQEIFWASGACLMVKTRLFHEVGGFDQDFFAHMEEIDLCWRLQRAGYIIFYDGSSTIYHLGGGTLSVSNPFKTYLNFKNGLSLIYKNLPAGELAIKFPIRIVLDWVASLKFTLAGSFKDGSSVIRAHRHFFSGWGRERLRRRSTAKFPYKRLRNQYHGMIVWDFFIAGKKKYSQLKGR